MDRPWSVQLFEERLVSAFREMQGRGIYAAASGELRLIAGQRIRGFELIALSQQVLGSRSPECKSLLTWARAQSGGESLSTMCAANGWSRSTIEERRRRGARSVVAYIQGDLS